MSIHKGLDVSDMTTHICVVDTEGKVPPPEIKPQTKPTLR